MSEYWTIKTGQRIKITDMTDSHLMNAIKLIERAYTRTIGYYISGPQPRGDMACDAFDIEFDALNEGGPSEYNEHYDYLVEEAEKRGLDSRETRENRLLNLELVVLKIVSKPPHNSRVE